MRITSIQLEIQDRPQAENLAEALLQVDNAPPSDLLVLPEIWTVGFFSFDRYRDESETLNGKTVSAFRDMAVKKACYLHMGSFVEKEDNNYYNTSLLLSPSGDIAARYRKIHLFGYRSREQQILTAGSGIATCETPFGVVGLTTCYDLRFPELYRMMVNQGTTMFLVSSAWPAARLEAWQLFNRVRALENLSFLVSCNCAGANGADRYAGHSFIVDPLGNILAEGGEEGEYVTDDIDPALTLKARKEFPALEDRVYYCAK
ncbi:carbon-nitrogen family hydrolase [bacterium]|nr:carbon-nitrogen family hydrolase [bacterium]